MEGDWNNWEFILAFFGIVYMLGGTLLCAFFRRDSRGYAGGVILFIFGAVMLVGNFLYYNPDILDNIQKNLALVLLGIIFVFIQILKRR